jgi:hypothetical protein
VQISLGRPYSIGGFTIFCGVGTAYFYQLKHTIEKTKATDPLHKEFSYVIDLIENTIRSQKYEGAAVGAFNANLISYELGIRKDMSLNATGGISIHVDADKNEALLNDVKAKLEQLDKD